MRVLKQDRKTGEVKLLPESTEDLWHIERILTPGDTVIAKSWRRFKIEGSDDAGEKKPVTISLNVEKTEFSAYVNRLRISGKIISGTPEEFVQAGSYHTIDAETGFSITIVKQNWRQHQIERIAEAVKETKRPKVGIVVLDESKAIFATVRGFGIDYNFEIDTNSSKRDDKFAEKEKQYFGDIASKLATFDTSKIIIAGPGFAKDNLRKLLQQKNPEILKKIIFDSVSNSERSGVVELLKRGTIAKVMQEERIEQELVLVERLKEEIGKNSGLACWGLKDVEQAIEYSAAKSVLVVDELLRTNQKVDALVESAYKKKVKVVVFSSSSQGGEELSGLGGFAALLKFKIS